MITQAVLIQTGPDDYQQGYAAIAAVEQTIAAGNQVQQVFFYGPGVLYASALLNFPHGIENLQQRWQQLSAQHGFELVVCATVAAEYGVSSEPSPVGALAAGFVAGGLTEWVTCLANTQQLIQFPTADAQPPVPAASAHSPWLFVFSSHAGKAQARHGLDMLMLAVSFDIPCQAFYQSSALSQLQRPTTPYDSLKKLGLLPDIFDFNDFYVSSNDVQQLNSSTLKVAVTPVTLTELTAMQQQARHIIYF